jgi:multidrug efflux pump subunit AcrA (membrane-fusion protein)
MTSVTRSAATSPPQLLTLATLTQLEQRARHCADETALMFLMVNDSHALAPYRQAVLWRGGRGDGEIAALSGLAQPDPRAPFNIWLVRQLAAHAGSPAGRQPGRLNAPGDNDSNADAQMWREHLPACAWWLPLPLTTSQHPPEAGLLLLREQPWLPADSAPLALLGDAYAHAWRALRQAQRHPRGIAITSPWGGRHRRRWLLAGALTALLVLALPVRQSVLAPAEVVARAPESVRAPLQGVVDRIDVLPNQTVKAGQLLVSLDARELQGKLEAARQALAVIEAEWRRGQQLALNDPQHKAELGLLQGRYGQAAADVDYYTQALQRTQLRASRDGIALFDDPADWIGRPVAQGERIMQVADPRDAELELQLPVADAIALPADARVRLFLNAAPATPVEASVLRVGYRAAATADGSLAYRVRARLQGPPPQHLRVGLKGTAKLYGERTVLAVYLLRRPLARLRIWLGL